MSDDVDDAQLLTTGDGLVNGAPSKADAIVHFHIGDTVTSLQKVALGPGCAEVLLYTTLQVLVPFLQNLPLLPMALIPPPTSYLQGGIGALLPFSSKEDLELLTALEMHLRQVLLPLPPGASSPEPCRVIILPSPSTLQEAPPLCGRDQLFFRSAYFPVKGVIDGDFVAQYLRLPPDEQRSIADELDRSPAEIAKKLEELASRVL